jgi:hypothetical protein
MNTGTTAGFVKKLAMSSSELYIRADSVALWRIFYWIAELKTRSAKLPPTALADLQSYGN